jgi:hypothetical protein
MADTNLFPVPLTLPCPYCGGQASRGEIRADTGEVIFSHYTEKSKMVGQVTQVTLQARHMFVAAWDGDEWKHAPGAKAGFNKVIERVGLKRPVYTDIAYTGWASCKGED